MIDEKKFILAGKAVFTLTRPDGKHYTYRVDKKTSIFRGVEQTVWFVAVGTGYSDSQYLGLLGEDGKLKITKASKFNHESPSVRTFLCFWLDLDKEDAIPHGIKMQHAGKCCVCSRVDSSRID